MAAPIALQLYTMRETLDQNLEAVLHQVAELGYIGVETAFFGPDVSFKTARRAIEAAGLTICSIHCELPIGAHQQAVLTQAADLGAWRIVWHGWPEDPRYGSLAGIAALAEEYNLASQHAQAAGFSLGLHNHWWECGMLAGKRVYQHLIERLDPAIFFELDTYWATVAGCDAPAVITELGPRVPLLHLKDGPGVNDQPKLAVGSGVMNIPAVVAASRNHAEWLIVELDDYAGPMIDAVAASYTYLVSNRLAKGRK